MNFRVPTLVVCPKIVDLFPKDGAPKVFADEFEEVKFVLELWVVFGQPLYQSEPSVVSELFKL